MLERMGPAWGGYHRLRVAETTDALALYIVRASGIDDVGEKSPKFTAVRQLVRAWRERHFDAYPPNFDKESENAFLYRYDLDWRLRRLRFRDALTLPNVLSICRSRMPAIRRNAARWWRKRGWKLSEN
jgi:hypothetical protein